MKSKAGGRLAKSRTLSHNSWEFYRKFLGKIMSDLPDTLSYKAQVVGALQANDVDALLGIADSLSSQKYDDARSHFLANQVACLIKKYPFPASLGSFDPKKTAWDKYLRSEALCARSNRYFEFVHDLDAPVQQAFSAMRGFIARVLGPDVPRTSWYEACDFGPGASIGVNGQATNLNRKIGSDWTVSPGAFDYGYAAVVHDWNLIRAMSGEPGIQNLDPSVLRRNFESKCTVVRHNKIAFASKTTKTDRVIAVEPLINGFLQKGLDQLMRLRLKRIGLDLSDQSINSEGARLGSLVDDELSFVTIDLSSASDSISIGLCRALLPPDWFDIMNSIRSVGYSYHDDVVRYEKFCSMGNGFCFPLETLLFAAAAHASGCKSPGYDFVVYGDDIVVRKRNAQKLLELLEIMGFEVNKEKTFLQGPFRESCGRDWFEGEDVRPFVLDFRFDTIESCFKFLNLSKRNQRSADFFSDINDLVMSLIPDYYRFLRPEKGPADSGIDADLDVFLSSPFARWNRHLQRWSWLELHHKPISDDWLCSNSAYALTIAVIQGANSEQPFTFRRKTRAMVVRVYPPKSYPKR